MKQIYILVLLIAPFLAHSQLTVKPYQDLDIYVYVEGSLLFVEKEVYLIANPGKERDSNIYLRNEAQLIQGKTNSTNAGDGTISIFQEGDATNYTYNYWSMPVSDFAANNTFGNLLFDPVTKTTSNPAIITSEYNGLSKPLTISNRWIFKLSSTDYEDWQHIGNKFNISPGEGFTMKGVSGTNTTVSIHNVPNNPGNKQRYDLRGKPNSGIYELDIQEGSPKLIGNPYPSALDLNLFLQENTNTTGIAYFWDSKAVDSHYLKEYEGGYGVYSPGAGTSGYVPAIFNKFDGAGNSLDISGATGAYYARRYSPIGQGFVVIGSGNGNGKIIFNNAHRSFIKENPLLSQFKTQRTSTSKSAEEEFPVLRLNIEFQNQNIRQILLVLQENSTKGSDHAKDAINMEYLSSDAGWLIDGESFLINVRPLDELEEIPLYVILSEASEIGFNITEAKGFKSNIFLFDAVTGMYHNLTNAPFIISLEAGEYPERFKLTYFNKEQTYINWEVVEDINNFSIFQNNPESRLEVRIPTKNAPRDIYLYDVQGKKVLEKKGITHENYLELSTRRLSKGLYILKIMNKDNTVISKKVIISN